MIQLIRENQSDHDLPEIPENKLRKLFITELEYSIMHYYGHIENKSCRSKETNVMV